MTIFLYISYAICTNTKNDINKKTNTEQLSQPIVDLSQFVERVKKRNIHKVDKGNKNDTKKKKKQKNTKSYSRKLADRISLFSDFKDNKQNISIKIKKKVKRTKRKKKRKRKIESIQMNEKPMDMDDDSYLLITGFIKYLPTTSKTHLLSIHISNDIIKLIYAFYDIHEIIVNIKDIIILQNGTSSMKMGVIDQCPKVYDITDKINHLNTYCYEWHKIEKLCKETFNSENVVLLTEKPFVHKYYKENMAKIMFERCNVRGLYIENDAVLSLFGIGKSTGSVLYSGFTSTFTACVYEGYCLESTVLHSNFGGRDLTQYLCRILTEYDYSIKILSKDGYYTKTSMNQRIIKDIKEKLCYIALDFDKELKEYECACYQLPDGTYISVGNQRFRTPEILFKPTIIGKESDGISKLLNESINECDIELRDDMYNNIVLSGGNTMFNGMAQRVKKEINYYSSKINVIDVENKDNLSWIGGSILSSCSSFNDMIITKHDYDEYGASIVHRKCF